MNCAQNAPRHIIFPYPICLPYVVFSLNRDLSHKNRLFCTPNCAPLPVPPTSTNPPTHIRYYGTQNTNSHSYTLLSTRQQGEQDTLQHKTTRMLINGLSLLATSVRRLFGYGALQHQQLRVMIVPSERDITN